MGKGTREQVEQRIDEVYGLVVDGASRNVILQYCASKWGIKRRQADIYVRICNERLEIKRNETYEKRLNRAIDRTHRLYMRCIKGGNLQTASTVLKELNDLERVKKALVEVTGKDGAPMAMTQAVDVNLKGLSDDELKALQQISEKIKGNEDQNTKPGGN